MSNAGAPIIQETSAITNGKEFGIVKRTTKKTTSRKMDVNMEKLEGKNIIKMKKKPGDRKKSSLYTQCVVKYKDRHIAWI